VKIPSMKKTRATLSIFPMDHTFSLSFSKPSYTSERIIQHKTKHNLLSNNNRSYFSKRDIVSPTAVATLKKEKNTREVTLDNESCI
jgi:hypothetical protein